MGEKNACQLNQSHTHQKCKTHSNTIKILLAVDNSPPSAHAIETVLARQWPPNTTVRVISAVTPPMMTTTRRGTTDTPKPLLTLTPQQADQFTRQVAEALRHRGLTAEAVIGEGPPAEVIVTEAEKWKADVIIMGAPPSLDNNRPPLGTVTHAVIRSAPCWVEILRAEE